MQEEESKRRQEELLQKKIADYRSSFGITYEVHHAKAPHANVWGESTVRRERLGFNDRTRLMSIGVSAHNGGRGNYVRIYLPYDGIVEIANELQERVELTGLDAYAIKHSASNWGRF